MVARSRIGNLVVGIDGDASELRSELQDVEGGIDNLLTSARATGLAFAGLGAGILAGFSRISQINTELRVGAGIAGVTIQEYQALSNTFRTFGLDADFAADIINDVSERLRDAQGGAQSYADAFASLNINLDEFAGLNRIDRLNALAEAIERVDADTAQLAVNELAGDQGQRLLAILRDLGAEGLSEAIEQNLQAVDFTQEQSDRILEATQRLETFKSELNDIALIATGELIGVFERVFAPFGEQTREDAEALREFLGLAEGLDFIDPAAPGIMATFADSITVVANAAELGSPALDYFFSRLSPDAIPIEPIAGLGDQISTLVGRFEDGALAAARFWVAVGDEAAALEALERLENDRLLEFFDVPDAASSVDAIGESIQRLNPRMQLAAQLSQNFFANIIQGGGEAEDVLLSLLSTFLQFGFGNLGAGRGFFGGSRQFGGSVFPGHFYLTHFKDGEAFIPDGPGQIITNNNNIDQRTINIAPGPYGAQDMADLARQLAPEAAVFVIGEIERQRSRPTSRLSRRFRDGF